MAVPQGPCLFQVFLRPVHVPEVAQKLQYMITVRGYAEDLCSSTAVQAQCRDAYALGTCFG
jgi:hypothetical protein